MVSEIPDCMICFKEAVVTRRLISGGVVLEVCKDCIKFGEEVKEVDADRLVFKNSKLVKHIEIV